MVGAAWAPPAVPLLAGREEATQPAAASAKVAEVEPARPEAVQAREGWQVRAARQAAEPRAALPPREARELRAELPVWLRAQDEAAAAQGCE